MIGVRMLYCFYFFFFSYVFMYSVYDLMIIINYYYYYVISTKQIFQGSSMSDIDFCSENVNSA